MIEFFSSIRNAIIFFLSVMLFLFIGVLIIPGAMQTYTEILDVVLLSWLGEAGIGASWWIIGLVVALLFMGASALVCTIRSLYLSYRSGSLTLRTVSPHIVHLGVIMMLAGHLTGSITGVMTEAVVQAGETFEIRDGIGFRVESIIITEPTPGLSWWEVGGKWTRGESVLKEAMILPSGPSYYGGLWVFIKSAESDPMRVVLMARGGAGVLLLLCGGFVFIAGCAATLWARAGQTLPGDDSNGNVPQ